MKTVKEILEYVDEQIETAKRYKEDTLRESGNVNNHGFTAYMTEIDTLLDLKEFINETMS